MTTLLNAEKLGTLISESVDGEIYAICDNLYARVDKSRKCTSIRVFDNRKGDGEYFGRITSDGELQGEYPSSIEMDYLVDFINQY